jgi:hypothetical protein
MLTTWAVDLADVEAVYPWQGYELIMVLVAIILWLLWHVIQMRQENRELEEDIRLYGSKESIRKALDDHPV